MQLFTSYFGRRTAGDWRLRPNAVAITTVRPGWAPRMLHCKDLAPTWTIVKAVKEGRITSEKYTELYLKLLENRGKTPQQVVNGLVDKSILLCYCGRDSFCHRHIAAKWLREGADVRIEELP